MFEDSTTVNSEDETAKNNFAKPLVMGSTVFNEDCMTVMARYPDKFFDLAIVDPPYGIGEANKFQSRYVPTSKWKNPVCNHTHKDWDDYRPDETYFEELMRVSKNQIIWGANYFTEYLPPSMGWIFWDKKMSGDFSDGELAFTSYTKALKKFEWLWSGFKQKVFEKRIHPTQKPVALFDFCLLYAKAEEGWNVLDTHCGSGSSRIACHKAKMNYVGCEIDKEYFEKQEARFKEFTSQLRLFG